MANEQTEKNKEAIRRLYEEYINQRRTELLPELIAADYVSPQGDTGPEGYRATVQGLFDGFPDLKFKIEDLVGVGDRVVVRWTWTGTHAGTFRGIPPSKVPVKNSGIVIYQMRDGKAVRSWLEADRLGVLQQIGAVQSNFGGPRPANPPPP